jgi:uncharacterized RDD family membrane protein YckC
VIVVAVEGDAPGCGVGALAFLVLYLIFAPRIWVLGVAGLVGLGLGVAAGLKTLEPGPARWREAAEPRVMRLTEQHPAQEGGEPYDQDDRGSLE